MNLAALRAAFAYLLGSDDVERWAGLLRYRPQSLGAGLAGAWVASHPDAARPGITHPRARGHVAAI